MATIVTIVWSTGGGPGEENIFSIDSATQQLLVQIINGPLFSFPFTS